MEKRVVATNRKARHRYHILEVYEAGLVLQGGEVKALREGHASLSEGFARFEEGELFLIGVHIGAYSHAGYTSHEPTRERKLLLNRRELRKLHKAAEVKGQTLVPLALCFREGWAKVELAVCVGKQLHDRRQAIAERETKRRLERTTRQRTI